MKSSQKFSERLHDWRKYYRLTSGQLSAYTGVPENVLIALEQGRLLPDVQTAGRLNQFFTANQNDPDNLRSQYYQPNQHYSYPGVPPAVSYTTARKPVDSYPADYLGSAYQARQAYSQPYPNSNQFYGQTHAPTQPVYQPSAYQGQAYGQQPAYAYQNAGNGVKRAAQFRTGENSGMAAKIFMLIIFIIPFVFLFAPFANLELSIPFLGSRIPLGAADISGHDMYIFTMLNFTAYAVIVQIGLWLTTLTGGIMVIMAILRLCGLGDKTFTFRTVLFYVYFIGAVFTLIGMIMSLGNMRWGLIVYTVCVFAAVVVRIITDGGAGSFKMKR
jgi:transcriptional regulator with XRE-family HTH domain